MMVRDWHRAALARLLAWDAACLPRVSWTSGGDASVRCEAPGATMTAAAHWPLGQRMAAAVQVVAAAAFLFERGWYPSRGLLRGGRVERGPGGVWYRLARLPRRQLDDSGVERRLRRVLASEAAWLVPIVLPVVRDLLPERADELSRLVRERLPWEAASGWVGVLLGSGSTAALRHPGGAGRALWARRLALPNTGVTWVEDEQCLAGLRAAVQGAVLDRGVEVVAGALDEADVAHAQARAAAAGRDVVVLTTVAVAGAATLELDAGTEPIWVLGPELRLTHAHAAAARNGRAWLARLVLEAGAARAFTRPPRPPEALRERAALASPAARALLGWLTATPIGLAEEDLLVLVSDGTAALPELRRLGLAYERLGVWHAAQPGAPPTPDRLAVLAARLAKTPAGVVAHAMGGGGGAAAWCEDRLEHGACTEVLAVAGALAAAAPVHLAGVEAALVLGRVAAADAWLQQVPRAERGAHWHALAAWWAEQAGASERASDELTAGGDGLPPRLQARRALAAAHAARRAGDREGQRRHLERAVALTSPPVAEAAVELAAWHGPEALRRLPRRRDDDHTARVLHLLALAALDRGSPPAAMTGLRAALRAASGENPCLLGEIHADVACAAILGDRPAIAERHLLLAEGLLERSGSRRAATVVRANRAVLANDRLDWRAARELTLAGRRLRGEVDDAGTWLFEMELARADLARGDVSAAGERLPGLTAAVARFPEHPVLGQAFACVTAHHALAAGDLPGALRLASAAEASERDLIVALGAAGEGRDPSPELSRRWGMVVTAQLLAAWQRGEEQRARAAAEQALARWPREASVGLARFAALLARQGERLGVAWDELAHRAEAELGAAALDGWVAGLRTALGPDPARVVRAVGDIVHAGSDALAPARLEALARALGLRGVALEDGGGGLARWGEEASDIAAVAAGVTVRAAGPEGTLAREALAVLARAASGAAAARASEVGETRPGGLLGGSQALAAVREEVARWGPLPLTALIVGEPGTGKELVARELHRCSGRRGGFVPVNCAGIPSALLEAELFGVARGAFTGADRDRAGLVEAAEGGTLFLDEVGELPLDLQGKLLRLLQEREVRRLGATRARTADVRFVAATNRDLKAAAAAGAFRQDLYYRLAVAVIEVPPLRVRPDDIATLARHFAERFAATLGRPGARLAPAAVEHLQRATWPGNVRELESAVARAVAASRPGEVLGPDRFPGLSPAAVSGAPLPCWQAALASFRRDYFTALLRETGGNRSQAARRAGISRQALLYHLRGLDGDGGAQ